MQKSYLVQNTFCKVCVLKPGILLKYNESDFHCRWSDMLIVGNLESLKHMRLNIT